MKTEKSRIKKNLNEVALKKDAKASYPRNGSAVFATQKYVRNVLLSKNKVSSTFVKMKMLNPRLQSKKETRSCPSCGTNIFKIEGCDQMWCTQCHTGFSWRTGLKVTGVIHNPHFYQWQNEGGAEAPIHVPGAVMCGGLVAYYHWRNTVRKFFTNYAHSQHISLWIERERVHCTECANDPVNHDFVGNPTDVTRWHGICNHERFEEKITEIRDFCEKTMLDLHRGVNHFTHVEVDRFRRICNNVTNNQQLRIKYICDEISEESFKSTLIKRDKKYTKSRSILEIYELVNVVASETMRDLFETMTDAENKQLNIIQKYELIRNKTKRLEKIRLYANKELVKISTLYSQTVGIIQKNFYTLGWKVCKKNLQFYQENPHLIGEQ